MYTHRYVRSRLVEENSNDRYDLIHNYYFPQPHPQQQQHAQPPKEYWTNGRTTLLFSSNGDHPKTGESLDWQQKQLQKSNQRYYPLVQQSLSSASSSSSIMIMSSKASSSTATDTSTISNSNTNNNNHVVRNSLIAGSVAGMTSTTLCHPFDVLRVKMQSSAPLFATTTATTTTTSAGAAAAAAMASSSTRRPQQRQQLQQSLGVVGTLRQTLQAGGGVRALYTGLALPLAAQAVYKSTIFTVNKVTEASIIEWKTQERYKLGRHNQHLDANANVELLTTQDRFVSGCMGGAVNAALFCTPVEYVRNQQIAHIGNSSSGGGGGGKLLQLQQQPMKQRQATIATTTILQQRSRSVGPISVIRNTIQSNGVSGLWRGLASTVLRDSIGCGFFFVAMAQTQDYLKRHPLPWEEEQRATTTGDQPLSTASLVVSGATAGMAFWLWALPIDTCKTWIQSGTASNLTHALQLSQRNGFWQSVPSLFRGWQVAYARGAPSAAITVASYSLIFQHLQQQEH